MADRGGLFAHGIARHSRLLSTHHNPPLSLLVCVRVVVQLRSDQVLRERGEGDTALTNPHIHLRRRYRKLYEDFKPHVLFWRLVLLARKLCLAIIVVLVSGNVQAQVNTSRHC